MSKQPSQLLTVDEAAALGTRVRSEHNMLTGSFAAELIGESYPLSKEMSDIVFQLFPDDETLGRRFAQWIDKSGGGR